MQFFAALAVLRMGTCNQILSKLDTLPHILLYETFLFRRTFAIYAKIIHLEFKKIIRFLKINVNSAR